MKRDYRRAEEHADRCDRNRCRSGRKSRRTAGHSRATNCSARAARFPAATHRRRVTIKLHRRRRTEWRRSSGRSRPCRRRASGGSGAMPQPPLTRVQVEVQHVQLVQCRFHAAGDDLNRAGRARRASRKQRQPIGRDAALLGDVDAHAVRRQLARFQHADAPLGFSQWPMSLKQLFATCGRAASARSPSRRTSRP